MTDSFEDIQRFIAELKSSEELTPEELAEIEQFFTEKMEAGLPETLAPAEIALPVAEQAVKKTSEREPDIRTKIGSMRLSERIKLAMFGDRTCRHLLVNDPNKLVHTAVLKNPKIQLPEIEDFTGNKNLSDGILRAIGEKDAWTQSYKVRIGLVTNPKTPLAISLKWLRYLLMPDIKKLARSKNVPQVIATAARKKLDEEKQRH